MQKKIKVIQMAVIATLFSPFVFGNGIKKNTVGIAAIFNMPPLTYTAIKIQQMVL